MTNPVFSPGSAKTNPVFPRRPEPVPIPRRGDQGDHQGDQPQRDAARAKRRRYTRNRFFRKLNINNN